MCHEPERTRKETVVADCRYSHLLAQFDLQEAVTTPTPYASENSRFPILGTNLVPSEYATSDRDVQELIIRKTFLEDIQPAFYMFRSSDFPCFYRLNRSIV
jgi:hypothetical protein